ncbi:GntR family transcriptional regulator [Herbaspirillum sp. meg3]|uniref:FadR/GntR family transcriptional regulator n=1 Tax=Herbaspirillum sp. meg3 TaxID=2025949 RepID=UPI000B988958|nr:FadR/GntR family transcriptional regulator [Herbaspirillum sp. meg3]ASU39564.1 GntR family transcriptional regulator [Herbaspirillum sp. meg3]
MEVNETPSPLMRPRKKTQSLSQEVVGAISEMISSGAIKPGEKLPTESEIMLTQGVSRTVVREAISRLQAAGLVETRHGIGTFVLEAQKAGNINIDPATITTMKDLLALLELRISLETETAGLAAARRTDEQLLEIRQALDAFHENLKKGNDTVGPDFRFHFQIATATGNRYFIEILSHLGAGVIPRKRLNTAELARDPQASYLDRVQREHEDIYEAIARRDTEAARAAMRNHLTNSRERLRRAQEAAESAADAQKASEASEPSAT